jgi:hypothetical protein
VGAAQPPILGGGSRTASDKAAPDSAAAGTNKAAADKAAADKAAAGDNNWHDKMDLALCAAHV